MSNSQALFYLHHRIGDVPKLGFRKNFKQGDTKSRYVCFGDIETLPNAFWWAFPRLLLSGLLFGTWICLSLGRAILQQVCFICISIFPGLMSRCIKGTFCSCKYASAWQICLEIYCFVSMDNSYSDLVSSSKIVCLRFFLQLEECISQKMHTK